jgi:microcystin-dependent protein
MVKSGLINITCVFLIIAFILVIFTSLISPMCNKKENYTLANGPNNMVLIDEYGTLSSIQFPKGMIIAWKPTAGVPTTEPPSGWAICDGTNGTPDLRGRFLVGSNPNGSKTDSYTVREVGQSGGSETHTLTTSEIPGHSHTYSDIYFSEHTNHNKGEFNHVEGSNNKVGLNRWVDNDNSFLGKKKSSDSSGGGAPHNNIPPFYSVIHIMKL